MRVPSSTLIFYFAHFKVGASSPKPLALTAISLDVQTCSVCRVPGNFVFQLI
jgi:hypothetical protein